jgi:hypothetical protein
MSNLNKYDFDKWLLYVNQARDRSNGLDLGSYTYQAFAIDTSSNLNQTEERNITITSSIPQIKFELPTPANDTSTSNTSIEINVSINESRLDEVKFNWNGTNYTLYNDSLVLVYNFDNISSIGEKYSGGSNKTVDVSRHGGNDGTLHGGSGPTWNSAGGKFNGAFEFDGSDDFISAPSAGLPTNDFTFSAWINLSAYDGTIFMSNGEGGNEFDMYIQSNGTFGTLINQGPRDAQTEQVIPLNTWTYVTSTRSGSQLQLYVNGIPDGSDTEGATIDYEGCDALFGTDSDVGCTQNLGNWFNGTIDEIRIWNRSLTPSEINQTYMSNLRKYDLDKWLLYTNQTKSPNVSLDTGNYTYQAFSIDENNDLNQTEERTIEITSAANLPTIGFVEAIPATNPSDGGTRFINFTFNATDTDGASNINTSSARAQFNYTGEPTRSNTSCVALYSSGNDVNFSCSIGMLYYDINDDWSINVSVKDNSDNYAENVSEVFTYNLLTAMSMSPTAMNWGTINLPDTDTGSNNDPIVINNTGNDNGLDINVTAYNLQGNETTTQYIFANNFTVENITQGCSALATTLSNVSAVNITSLYLYRGDNSLNFWNATSGQEQAFFCLKGVPQDISSQEYSSLAYGAWEIRIWLVALIPQDISSQEYSSLAYGAWEIRIWLVALIPATRKKKKKKQKSKEKELIDSLDLLEYLHIVDKLKEQYKFSNEEIVKTIVEKAGKKYKIDRGELLRIIKAREGITIPATIFSKKLGSLEAITKYMKENLGMNYKEISKELRRDERTIWTAYKKAKEKQPGTLKVKETKINMPVSIFENESLTTLESIIIYLKEKGFKFSEIAKLLERDQRNIGTIYSRATKKIKKKGKE